MSDFLVLCGQWYKKVPQVLQLSVCDKQALQEISSIMPTESVCAGIHINLMSRELLCAVTRDDLMESTMLNCSGCVQLRNRELI